MCTTTARTNPLDGGQIVIHAGDKKMRNITLPFVPPVYSWPMLPLIVTAMMLAVLDPLARRRVRQRRYA